VATYGQPEQTPARLGSSAGSTGVMDWPSDDEAYTAERGTGSFSARFGRHVGTALGYSPEVTTATLFPGIPVVFQAYNEADRAALWRSTRTGTVYPVPWDISPAQAFNYNTSPEAISLHTSAFLGTPQPGEGFDLVGGVKALWSRLWGG
jgi:hypothetical protein